MKKFILILSVIVVLVAVLSVSIYRNRIKNSGNLNTNATSSGTGATSGETGSITIENIRPIAPFVVIDKAFCRTVNSIKGWYNSRNNSLVFGDNTCENERQINCKQVYTDSEGWYYNDDVLFRKGLCPSRI